uniref:PPIase cyclophilin-type domain-containing protein n=1 Tax=Oryza glumipatula TaxID=40148 RepID=A0A0D9YL86_9ORYZ
MELYADVVPLTSENFRTLYTSNKKPLDYKGSVIHSMHCERIHFFTCVAWFDGNHVVFDRLISGFHNLKAIEAEVGSTSGTTTKINEVKIANCGEVVIAPVAVVNY